MLRLSFGRILPSPLLIAAVAQSAAGDGQGARKQYHLRPGRGHRRPKTTAAHQAGRTRSSSPPLVRTAATVEAGGPRMMTDDFRFVHDKGRRELARPSSWRDEGRGHCARLKTGEDFQGAAARAGAGDARGLADRSLRRARDRHAPLLWRASKGKPRDAHRNRQLHDPVEAGGREMADGAEHLLTGTSWRKVTGRGLNACAN